jgi:spore protease
MFFRTDLALERRDIYRKANNLEDEIPGIKYNVENIGKTKITRVEITSKEGEEALNKKIGNYITIDVNKINNLLEEENQKIIELLSNEIEKIVDKHIGKSEDILVVGLGNLYSTPDSLGSKVVKKIEITRHIKKYMPQYIDKNARAISAVAPGVLGMTGIETWEFLKGIVDNVKPKLILAIDSLCSRSVNRISKSIQLSDTGIVPGGGVGNARIELTKESLGIPVIALGIPTCVDVATITEDGLNLWIDKLEEKENIDTKILEEKNNYESIKEALLPSDLNFIVTPKEIDELIENMTEIVSAGINNAI